MRVVVDRDLCESNAVCMRIVPEVFQVRDDDRLYFSTTIRPRPCARGWPRPSVAAPSRR